MCSVGNAAENFGNSASRSRVVLRRSHDAEQAVALTPTVPNDKRTSEPPMPGGLSNVLAGTSTAASISGDDADHFSSRTAGETCR